MRGGLLGRPLEIEVAYSPRPHISMALQHLRFGVTASAAVLSLCLIAQVGVWAVVHFTDARLTHVAPAPDGAAPLRVVRSAPSPLDETPDAGAKATQALTPVDAAEVNQVPGQTHVRLRRLSGLVQSIGVIASLVFAALAFQGVMIAGGAALPGVEKVVTAGSWAMVIALVCAPISSVLPTVPFSGVFVGYEGMVQASASVRTGVEGAPGPMGYYAWNLLTPVVLLAGIALVLWRFRAGVEAGVIVTSISQLDEKLESEIRNMRLGQLSSPRAMGALNAALGDASGAYTNPHYQAPVAPAQPQRPLGAPSAVMPEPAPLRRPLEPVGPPEILDPKRRPI
ncbi:MAG TPA: hypothetical protein DEB06_01125 [Phycisphaerales bacterium]|nr:hypothetical protein [Phycisphaerales bacterium]